MPCPIKMMAYFTDHKGLGILYFTETYYSNNGENKINDFKITAWVTKKLRERFLVL